MTEKQLSLRALNRSSLARQMLLERVSLPVTKALEKTVGIQAQQAPAPYVWFWTRLKDFQRDDLAQAIEAHEIVKATFFRATLHLTTREDYLRFRTAITPALTGAAESIVKGRENTGFDQAEILEMGRKFIAQEPRSFAEITAYFSETLPQFDIGALRYSVRTHLHLIQVPTDTYWSYPGNPKFTLAETWNGEASSPKDETKALIKRILAAFGPASLNDLQKWTSLMLKDILPTFKDELVIYHDEKKKELFDIADMPLVDEDTPVPIRFLPGFDNLLIAYDKRQRIVADDYRKKVYLPGLIIAPTILIDGFVEGVWKAERKKKEAFLHMELFKPLTQSQQSQLEEEAEALIRFLEPEATRYHLQVSEA